MKALVIGYGSIGSRHARLLSGMGEDVACVTGNAECPYPVFPDIQAAVTQYGPELAIVANRTCDHLAAMRALANAGYRGLTLVEKPLFESEHAPPALDADKVFVAYNLRCHPMVRRLRDLLAGRRVFNASFHVGQYLPDWRPETDYRKGYSASREQGGGVLRDLSHELDLALWLLGPWQRLTARGGRFSDLEIDSDDVFHLLLETEECPVVSIQMDYLASPPRRGFSFDTDRGSLTGDFLTGALHVEGDREKYEVDRDFAYAAQLEALLHGSGRGLCSLDEGARVTELIAAAEMAAKQETWVKAP